MCIGPALMMDIILTILALEQTGQHDAVPLVGAVKCLPNLVSDDEPGTLHVSHLGVHVYMCTCVHVAHLGVLAVHHPADVLTQPVVAEELVLHVHTLPLQLAVQTLPPGHTLAVIQAVTASTHLDTHWCC